MWIERAACHAGFERLADTRGDAVKDRVGCATVQCETAHTRVPNGPQICCVSRDAGTEARPSNLDEAAGIWGAAPRHAQVGCLSLHGGGPSLVRRPIKRAARAARPPLSTRGDASAGGVRLPTGAGGHW
jgi:hypothetical protein